MYRIEHIFIAMIYALGLTKIRIYFMYMCECFILIGEKSLKNFQDVIKRFHTIFWNGPVGVFELENFAKGSNGILQAVNKANKNGAVSVVGGDTLNLIKQNKGSNKFVSQISTGGGASLELVEGKELPVIVALSDSKDFI